VRFATIADVTLPFLGKLDWLTPLLLRGYLGVTFFYVHGLSRLRGREDVWDWGRTWVENLAPTVEPQAVMYVPLWIEFVGGFALLAGVLTRWAALLLAVAAGFLAYHETWKEDFALPQGWTAPALFLVACLVLAIRGPGSVSLDRLFFGRDAV